MGVAVSLVVVWVAGAVAVWTIGRHPNAERFDPGGVTHPYGPFAYWDSGWFVEIAREGYDDPESPAFFPLYPLLVRVFGTLTGSEIVGGVVVSLACYAAALWLLHRLVALDFGPDVATLTVLLVALFPAAAYFTAVYSESLFLLLSVAAVYAARTDRWALAALAGALAAATRSAGVVLVVPLALLWWRSRERRPRDLAAVAAVPLGLVAFVVYLWVSGGDPLGPFEAQKEWGREFAGPLGAVVSGAEAAWSGLERIAGGDPNTWPVYDTAKTDVALFAGLLVTIPILVGALRRLPAAYSLYAAAALAIPLSYPADGQPLMSLPRFVAVLWPLHLWVAVVLVERPVARRVVLGLSLLGLALFSARLATWRWVG
ncbi:MAG TPA: mannosyltransferase family protein [Solirubrobacteraceae bacterium]|nr:mannosyltransferase family protein [Solirubrobacteraceae bacterium]